MESYLAQAAFDTCYYQQPWDYPNVSGGGMAPTNSSVAIDAASMYGGVFSPSVLTFLSRTTLNPANNTFYFSTPLLHDKATKMACTVFRCPAEGVALQAHSNLTYFLCTYDKIVQHNERIYEVDHLPLLGCPASNRSLLSPENRLHVLDTVNSIRRKTRNGTLLLDDNTYALAASKMDDLVSRLMTSPIV